MLPILTSAGCSMAKSHRSCDRIRCLGIGLLAGFNRGSHGRVAGGSSKVGVNKARGYVCHSQMLTPPPGEMPRLRFARRWRRAERPECRPFPMIELGEHTARRFPPTEGARPPPCPPFPRRSLTSREPRQPFQLGPRGTSSVCQPAKCPVEGQGGRRWRVNAMPHLPKSGRRSDRRGLGVRERVENRRTGRRIRQRGSARLDADIPAA